MLQQRRRAVPRDAATVHDRDRHLGAVARRRPQVLGDVPGGVEVAEHRLTLQQHLLARVDVVVVGGDRRGERGVRVPDDGAVDLLVGVERRSIRGLAGAEVDRLVPGAQHPHLAQAAGAFLDHEELVEHVEAGEQRIFAVRHDLGPARCVARLVQRSLHQPEVERLPVAADDPLALAVFSRIFVPAAARQQHLEFERGVVGARVARLGGHRAARLDQKVLPVLGGRDGGIKGVVLLLVHQHVLRRVRAEPMLAYPQSKQRLRVLFDVQHRAAVVRPRNPVLDVLDRVGQRQARCDVLDPQRVLAAAHRILGVGQQPVVRAHLVIAEFVEVVAERELAHVEQHLLHRSERARLARMDRILRAGLVTRVIPVAPVTVRHR